MAPQPFKVKAVHDYASPHDDDLSFPSGQLITVTEEEDDEWYYGEYKDADGITKSGLFPRNHVEKYEPITPPRPTRNARKTIENEDAPQPAPKGEPEARMEPPVEKAEPTTVEPEEPLSATAAKEEPEPPVRAAEQAAPAAQSPVQEATAEPQLEIPLSPAVAAALSKPAPPPREEVTPAKRAPPPVAEKPSGGSFKDRIAAFNRPAAGPVAPIKPGGLSGGPSSGFIKKPFVPAPPSRNAYVPPPREKPQVSYHREEEPGKSASAADAGAERPAESAEAEPTEDQPKPTSLKDRIALLQKQQLEQAARHADAAQKKEKPKRPPKKRTESGHESHEVGDPDAIDATEEPLRGPSMDIETDESATATRPPRRRGKSKEEVIQSTGRELFSDTNDADQSADPETEDGEHTPAPGPPPKPPRKAEEPAAEKFDEEGGDKENDDDEDEEEMDPEIRRRMEIRERMAKMSGGMGMAGMFGPAGGLPPMKKKPPKSESEGSKRTESNEPTSPANVPVMALPGMSMPGANKVKSPPVHEDDDASDDGAEERGAEEESDDDVLAAQQPPPRRSTDGQPPPPPRRSIDAQPQPPARRSTDASRKGNEAHAEESVTSPKSTTRAAPPPPPQERPVPAVPSEPRPPPVPTRTPTYPPEEASSSEEEEDDAPPPPPPKAGKDEKLVLRAPPPVPPTRPEETTSPKSPRAPPVPTAAPPVPAPHTRAPPPPPPTSPPKQYQESPEASDSEEEVTEYEGDYDTDIAAHASHKDALTAHDNEDSTDDTLTGDEASYHHAGLPSLGVQTSRPPPPAAPPQAPRGVPPPPPSQPPRQPPAEAPRGAPPPPPVPLRSSLDQAVDAAWTRSRDADVVMTPTQEVDNEDLYVASPPKRRISEHSGITSPPAPPSAAPPPPHPKNSLDARRESIGGRRSTEVPRQSADQGFIAADLDLVQSSQWWIQRRMPPPSLQNRNDVAFEMDESTAIQNGQELVSKNVYVIYMDYSKTTINARFAPNDPSRADLQQRHEPPPARLRQDQLEDASMRYGAQIADMAKSKTNSIVGQGTPSAFVSDIFAHLNALPPVGNRAYGALVYVNLANATVQQHDEIRAGDIVSFRNAKLQGHRGAMKQKYSSEVGKPDHVGVVVDWDGTKKKIQAWEQGRESKKVKVESFKLGDLKSGEVKVWRVMPRTWVGWGTR